MGLFSSVRPKAMSSTLERLILDVYGSRSTHSGVSVSSDTAMQLITAHSCVKILSQSIAQLPLHFMKESGKNKEKATDHPYYRLLHDQPNSWMTAAEFWGMCVALISTHGNFFAYKAGLEGRPVRELIPLPPGIVQEVTQNKDYTLTYKLQLSDGSTKNYPQSKIMHIRGLVLNGYMGVNPIEDYARETIGLGLSAEQFLAKYYGKGMHPGAVIEHPLPLSAPAHANLRETLKEKYAGLGNAQDLMLIDEGMKISFPEIRLVDQQFLEAQKLNESQIAGLFRVPLFLLQAGDAPATYASAEQFMLAFVTHALTPIIVNIEQAIKRDLLSDEEKKTHYPKFNMTGLLRGDSETRASFYRELINCEVMSPNEARELEDLNPYEGGDEYRVRTSTVKEQKGGDSKGGKDE